MGNKKIWDKIYPTSFQAGVWRNCELRLSTFSWIVSHLLIESFVHWSINLSKWVFALLGLILVFPKLMLNRDHFSIKSHITNHLVAHLKLQEYTDKIQVNKCGWSRTNQYSKARPQECLFSVHASFCFNGLACYWTQLSLRQSCLIHANDFRNSAVVCQMFEHFILFEAKPQSLVFTILLSKIGIFSSSSNGEPAWPEKIMSGSPQWLS